jgi:hypothetical protein
VLGFVLADRTSQRDNQIWNHSQGGYQMARHFLMQQRFVAIG